MKLEDAEKKWCPWIKRVCGIRNNGVTSMNTSYERDVCKTTSCMMWRWTGVAHSEGYCGLAGFPT